MTDQDGGAQIAWIQQVVDRFEGPLVRYCARITGNVELARDVVQDAFLKLCRQSPADVAGHLEQWLYTVCRNRALDVRRKETRMQTISEAQATACESREKCQLGVLEQSELSGQMLRLLAALPDNQQEVVRLKFQGGLSYRDISRVTNLSVSNVGYLIHMAIHTLRRELSANLK
jgi:RNA polymerase sigma-70 factor (ECF subfamily)